MNQTEEKDMYLPYNKVAIITAIEAINTLGSTFDKIVAIISLDN